ncbi:outer membrane protein assembly factor BamD [Neomegalonema perideroedes]|uniref:outer membrane protein assembly factor BamD n=1 Tax=Neomegalonema perideroedes TaxID=217219 RepID=UPI000366BF0F|nr:outer membrane protein assembly factor BamD [Neomegalonema perideroedes]
MALTSSARSVAKLGAAALLMTALAGCQTARDAYDGAASWFTSGADSRLARPGETPESIFGRAEALMNAQNYRAAAPLFDEVERLHPYSPYAKRAMIMSAFASFEAAEYDKAILAADRFVDFYPSDAETAYARYLIAQSYYERIVDVGRDQSVTEEAQTALEEVILRHPGTPYAREAQVQLDLVRDHLAGKEMEIGRFYLARGDYLAAINRFRNVVENHQGSTHVPEALHRLVESYLRLGVVSEARSAAAVLGHNYPGSEWYQASYAMLQGQGLSPEMGSGSWLRRIYRQVIEGEIL